MNTRVKIGLAMVGLAWAATGWGRIPEPDTIVGGTLGNVPTSGVEVRAMVDGATLATAEVTGWTGTFVLRIPMDDGASPRLAGTAKANDRVRLVAVNTATGVEAEILETANGGWEIPSGRGQMLWGTFQIATGALEGGDADGDGLPDEWEAQYAAGKDGHAGLNLAKDDASADNDGDGRSNWEEYVAGTDPLDETSVFALQKMDFENGMMNLSAGPSASGRRYTLKKSERLGETAKWEDVATAESSEDGGTVEWKWTGVAGDMGYFRVDVEMVP